MVPDCIIEPDYNPTEPNVKEVEEFGYETARILRTITFRDRAERMKHKPWPKVAAFYSDLAMGSEGQMVVLDDDEEMNIVENKGEQEGEEMVEESTYKYWVILKAQL